MFNYKPLYNYFRNNRRRSVVDVNDDVIFKLTTLINHIVIQEEIKCDETLLKYKYSRSKRRQFYF